MASSRPAALIVEDHPFVGMVASDILRTSGFETFHAYDARDAEAVLDRHPEIEVIVADAQLAGDASGIELCRRIAAARPDVQLVVTCAGEIRSGEVPDGARLLRKPYASGELSRLVGERALAEA
jgi:CheY-like chemotaxis protein